MDEKAAEKCFATQFLYFSYAILENIRFRICQLVPRLRKRRKRMPQEWLYHVRVRQSAKHEAEIHFRCFVLIFPSFSSTPPKKNVEKWIIFLTLNKINLKMPAQWRTHNTRCFLLLFWLLFACQCLLKLSMLNGFSRDARASGDEKMIPPRERCRTCKGLHRGINLLASVPLAPAKESLSSDI